jgi:TatD DNase family protein
MNSNLVDFHCHLDLYPDFSAAIAEAESAGVYTLTVTTTPKAWSRNHELTREKSFVRAALGLHPQLVQERGSEFDLWERHLSETRYIGEVGIDAGPRFYRSLELQKDIFERVLKSCAREGGKILTVHSVRSATLVLDLIEQNLPGERGQVVLHWFSGSKSEARRAIKLGCYFSLNHQMMQTERGRDLVRALPRDRILTETDGPFTQVENRPSAPRDAIFAVDAIANLHAVTVSDIASQIGRNLKTLLKP